MASGNCNKCGQPTPKLKTLRTEPDKGQLWCHECYLGRRAERNKDYCKQDYQRHRSARDNVNKAWAAAHPETSKAIKERWLRTHREQRLKSSMDSWKRNYDKNREKIYANVKERRARKKGAGGRVTPTEWATILETFNHHCAYCLLPFTETRQPTQDHLLPLVRGGQHTVDNIVPACRSCNSRKQRRTLSEFAAAA